ncbi:MAG TPA: class I SAM-dependent methyltransferase [Vicinamibacteria bacterium]|nr:class I SAM-dependent methyltransferase [Vicinamibacteria bacterium]
MHSRPSEAAQLAYDRVADLYDDLWTPHVQGPNARLTRDLRLRRGERVADLACGTGVYTLEMGRLVRPGEVVGVDYSEGMLATARDRAAEEDLHATWVHARAEEFIAAADPASFDVVSMRFALTYLDWQSVLPGLGRMLRPGGRVGLLTSLTSSLPQLEELYSRFRKSPEPVWKLFKHTQRSLPETWRIYRRLKDSFGDGHFIRVPGGPEEVAERLAAGGLATEELWTERIRLWFDSGAEAVDWMRASGCAAHGSLDQLEPRALQFLTSLFAAGMEGFREPEGVPLDLVVGGIIARR